MKTKQSNRIITKYPDLQEASDWIQEMMELDKSHLTIDEIIALEMELARTGSMIAAEEAKTAETRAIERKEAKERMACEGEHQQRLLRKRIIEYVRKKAKESITKEVKDCVKRVLALKMLNLEQVATTFNLPIQKVQELAEEVA